MKKYSTILADPPWKLSSMHHDKWASRLEDKYPTMTTDELCDMGISLRPYLNDDCSLFLWATHTTLPDALQIMRKWGFKYHCLITWDKGSGWSHYGFHRKTEMVLYGYRGKININQRGKYIPTLISERKTTHSVKPNILYQWLDSNTQRPRLELFARQKVEGWDSIGFDIDGCDIRKSLDKLVTL